jgi:hypothetical protein
MQARLAAERQKRRMIRISTFDERDEEKLIAVVPEEQLGEDVFLAAFRIRMECNHERQDVEVIEYRQGLRYEAASRHGAIRMEVKRRRQIQVWFVVMCSSFVQVLLVDSRLADLRVLLHSSRRSVQVSRSSPDGQRVFELAAAPGCVAPVLSDANARAGVQRRLSQSGRMWHYS